MNLDWDKLRIFHAVAEAGSFTHAGDTLNLSQSAISRQISSLEDQLNVPLFHRHARGLLLTEQGELLLKATKEVYEKLALLEGRMADTKTTPEGPLKVTIPGFLGAAWLAPRLNRFRLLYPKMALTLTLDNRVLNLGMREADAGIRLYKPTQPDLINKTLTSIRFHLCASRAYLKEAGAPKTIHDLKNHWLIGYPAGTPLPYEDADRLFEMTGVDKDTAPNVILMNSTQAIYNTVKSGAGIAYLPHFMIAQDSDIETILPSQSKVEIPVFFVYPQERRNSTRIQVFRDFLTDELNNQSL